MFAVVVPKSEMFSGEMTYLTYTNSSGVFFRSQHLIQVWRPRMFFFFDWTEASLKRPGLQTMEVGRSKIIRRKVDGP